MTQRIFLVTTLVCSECGEQLTLSRQAACPPHTKPAITGGAKVENHVAVHPCPHCYSKARAAVEAFRALEEAASE